MEKRRIVLYGTSVIVGTIGASLRRSSRYKVIPLLPDQPNELENLAPDVVLFDLDAAHPVAAFSLLEKLPGLLLVGISPDKNLVKVWSGRQLRELSTQELMGVIDYQLKNAVSETFEGISEQ